MTKRLPTRLLAAVLARTQPKRWSDRWKAQLHTTCDGCAEDDHVMLVDERVVICAPCHQAHLVLWRKEDAEDEALEFVLDDIAHLHHVPKAGSARHPPIAVVSDD